ncbi:MAG: Methylated-DNA--protein-cysteine methyltransferase [Candidatus Parcubacteria bacterium]|jgi:O-6-methylguanine DNA methyltransferase
MKKKNQPSFSKGAQTPFAQEVYLIVSKIPKGKTMTYAEVARKAGKPDASRAVGSILGKNRNKEVPCHRVIRSDGGMGGYAFGGVKKKAEILKREAMGN